jgi:hypothetical protein
MGKAKFVILRFSILLISVLSIDGGRSFLSSGDRIRTLLTSDHLNDMELPHQHQLNNFCDEEKFSECVKFDFSCYSCQSVNFLYTLDAFKTEFSVSVWQPPELFYS